MITTFGHAVKSHTHTHTHTHTDPAIIGANLDGRKLVNDVLQYLNQKQIYLYLVSVFNIMTIECAYVSDRYDCVRCHTAAEGTPFYPTKIMVFVLGFNNPSQSLVVAMLNHLAFISTDKCTQNQVFQMQKVYDCVPKRSEVSGSASCSLLR